MFSSSSDFVSDFMWLLLFVIEVVERRKNEKYYLDGGRGGREALRRPRRGDGDDERLS